MSSQDETQIRDLFTSYERTLNTSDADAAASLYHTKGTLMPMGFPSSKGATDIRAAYAGIFGMIRLKIAFKIEEIEVDHDTAVAVTSSKGTVTILAKGIEAPESNRELFVLRRQNGAWLLGAQSLTV